MSIPRGDVAKGDITDVCGFAVKQDCGVVEELCGSVASHIVVTGCEHEHVHEDGLCSDHLNVWERHLAVWKSHMDCSYCLLGPNSHCCKLDVQIKTREVLT